MKRAIVTGASSGIGEAIAKVLCEMEYEVYGIGRSYAEEKDVPENYHPLVCDLLDTPSLTNLIKEIRGKGAISVLVNGAGVGYYGLHEELDYRKIQTMVRTNLEVPMILTQLLLRDLKQQKGIVVNVSSVTAGKSNPHGCAYGATKAGLSSFSDSLFEEVRKYGVRVVNLQPDMTRTKLYRNADFCEGEDEDSYLLPEEVAETLRFFLSQREGMVATNITLRPQLHRIRRKRMS